MIERYINNGNRTASFSKTEIIYLLFLIVAGTIASFFFHYKRPFVGDEVATLIQMQKSATYILTTFEPWLTMNYFILAEKYMLQIASGNQFSLFILPAIAGIATIPLTAVLAKMLTSKKTALVAATLIAFNPYLISYSGTLRSYSLLAALSVLTVILFFVWYKNRTFKNGIYVALSSYVLMLSHLNGAYTLAYIFLLAGTELLFILLKKDKKDLLTFVIPMSFSMAITFISYISIIDAIRKWGIPWHETPPTSISFIFPAFADYFGSDFYGWASALFLLIAIYLTIKAQNNPLLILLPIMGVSVLLMSIQGISHFPDAFARFLIFLVPVCSIFIAEGIVYISSVVPVRNIYAITIIVLLLIATWIPDFRQLYKPKIDRPYADVAAFLKKSPKGTTVVSIDWSTNLNLNPYFSDSTYTLYELNNYSREKHVQSGRNFYLINAGFKIKTDHPVHTFGNIQVIVYPVTDYKDQLLLIRNDLEKHLSNDLVAPHLAGFYSNLNFLNKNLENDPVLNFKYYDLAVRCSQLLPREKNKPISLRRWNLENAGYNLSR